MHASQKVCEQLGCCWHAAGVAPSHHKCIKKEVVPVKPLSPYEKLLLQAADGVEAGSAPGGGEAEGAPDEAFLGRGGSFYIKKERRDGASPPATPPMEGAAASRAQLQDASGAEAGAEQGPPPPPPGVPGNPRRGAKTPH